MYQYKIKDATGQDREFVAEWHSLANQKEHARAGTVPPLCLFVDMYKEPDAIYRNWLSWERRPTSVMAEYHGDPPMPVTK